MIGYNVTLNDKTLYHVFCPTWYNLVSYHR